MIAYTHDMDRENAFRPPESLTLPEAVSLLNRLAEDPEFLLVYILPLLEQAEGAESWYVAERHDSPDGSCSLQIFVWPSGAWTRIHDHSSWGTLRCVAGSILEERYERLDNGSRPEHARLKMAWRRPWKERDGVSTVLPYDGGIHRIGNPNESPAISVHLYGPRLGRIDGRDYDPSRDYVCDRKGD